jgi:hypothetical protein
MAKQEKHGGLAVVMLIALAAPVAACAQALRDPMRPADAPAARGAAEAPAAPGVQVVINSPTRQLAVIDGNVVHVGRPARNGTLAAVSDSVVVVSKDGERNVLLLHPNIDKKPAKRERP